MDEELLALLTDTDRLPELLRLLRERYGQSPAAQAALLRCVAGDPWRLVNGVCGRYWVNNCGEPMAHRGCRDCAPILAWNDGAVPKLARAAYEDRRPDGLLDPRLLAVLADALEESGCSAEEACPDCGGQGWYVTGCEGGALQSEVCACKTDRVPNPLLAHLRETAACQNCDGHGRVIEGRYGRESECPDCGGSGRIPARHARGCWVIDLLLGKE